MEIQGTMMADFVHSKYKNDDTDSKHSGSDNSYKDRTQPTRWKPSEDQKKWLLRGFQENPYPDMDTKIRLAERLSVKRAQISKWFQHKRESLTKLGHFQGQKQRERRTKDELDVLEDAFSKHAYPTQNQVEEVLNRLGGSLSPKQVKLWFKHKRNTLARRGELELKSQKRTMRSFTNEEIAALTGALVVLPEMDNAAVDRLADHLAVHRGMVANWLQRQQGFKQQRASNAKQLPQAVLNQQEERNPELQPRQQGHQKQRQHPPQQHSAQVQQQHPQRHQRQQQRQQATPVQHPRSQRNDLQQFRQREIDDGGSLQGALKTQKRLNPTQVQSIEHLQHNPSNQFQRVQDSMQQGAEQRHHSQYLGVVQRYPVQSQHLGHPELQSRVDEREHQAFPPVQIAPLQDPPMLPNGNEEQKMSDIADSSSEGQRSTSWQEQKKRAKEQSEIGLKLHMNDPFASEVGRTDADVNVNTDRIRKPFEQPMGVPPATRRRSGSPRARHGKFPPPLAFGGRGLPQHAGPSNLVGNRPGSPGQQSLPPPQSSAHAQGSAAAVQPHPSIMQSGLFSSATESPVTAFGPENPLMESLSSIPAEPLQPESMPTVPDLTSNPNEARWLNNLYPQEGGSQNFSNNGMVWLS